MTRQFPERKDWKIIWVDSPQFSHSAFHFLSYTWDTIRKFAKSIIFNEWLKIPNIYKNQDLFRQWSCRKPPGASKRDYFFKKLEVWLIKKSSSFQRKTFPSYHIINLLRSHELKTFPFLFRKYFLTNYFKGMCEARKKVWRTISLCKSQSLSPKLL